MDSSVVACAIDAAISIVVALDLPADDAIVLQNSNKLALRLLPCHVFARVAPLSHEHARFEVELAQRLAMTRCSSTVGTSCSQWSRPGVGTPEINFRTEWKSVASC